MNIFGPKYEYFFYSRLGPKYHKIFFHTIIIILIGQRFVRTKNIMDYFASLTFNSNEIRLKSNYGK